MIRHALWFAEQQFEWSKRNFTPTQDNEGVWHISTIPFYVAPFAAISGSPYIALGVMHDKLSWTLQAQSERSFLVRSFGIKLGKRQAAKFALTKIASRAIPYVGWGLLAYDLWHVGKWIGEKTNPFDS